MVWPAGQAAGQFPLWPTLAVVGATVAWAYGSIYARSAALPRSALVSAGGQMLTGGLMLAALGLGSGEAVRFENLSLKSGLALGYLIVFGSVVAFTAYNWLNREIDPTVVSTYAFVNPVVAVVLGCLLAGESLSPRALWAGGLVVGAVALMVLARVAARRPASAG